MPEYPKSSLSSDEFARGMRPTMLGGSLRRAFGAGGGLVGAGDGVGDDTGDNIGE